MVKERRKNKKQEEEECVGKMEVEQRNLMEFHPQQQQQMIQRETKEKKAGEVRFDKGKALKTENEQNRVKTGREGKKDGEKPQAQPDFVILRVLMHCEGCAKKVRDSIRGFEGVEEVRPDCRTNTVMVKGKKAAQDPKKLVDRIYKKSGKRAEIISPVPVPVPVPVTDIESVFAMIEMPDEKKEVEAHQIEIKKKAQGIMVVLKIQMHCQACSEAIKNRILRLREVEEVITDLKASQVTVKGDFDPKSLLQYIYNRTGKKAVVVKQEPIFGADIASTNPKPDMDSKPEKEEEKQSQDEKTEQEKENEEAKDKEIIGGAPFTTVVTVAEPGTGAAGTVGRADHYNYYYPRYPVEYVDAYPPQMFSDENPNACVVM